MKRVLAAAVIAVIGFVCLALADVAIRGPSTRYVSAECLGATTAGADAARYEAKLCTDEERAELARRVAAARE